ncbi:MAG: hypothetical protein IJ323_05800 [Clostridia bacterium]|nr:hypothetical protein [Clostridia bacterium]
MIESDTIKLLRECDAGVKMGISAIEDTSKYVKDPEFKKILSENKIDHEKLDVIIEEELSRFHDEGKEPEMIAKGMSWLKTNVKLAMDASDGTVADLITDGCNMGVKYLSGYLNKYKAADERSKDIAKNLITLEERLAVDVRKYL